MRDPDPTREGRITPVTVAELAERLSKLPPDLIVEAYVEDHEGTPLYYAVVYGLHFASDGDEEPHAVGLLARLPVTEDEEED